MTARHAMQHLLQELRDECQRIAAERGIADRAHILTRTAYRQYLDGADYTSAITAAERAGHQLSEATQ